MLPDELDEPEDLLLLLDEPEERVSTVPVLLPPAALEVAALLGPVEAGERPPLMREAGLVLAPEALLDRPEVPAEPVLLVVRVRPVRLVGSPAA